MLKEINGAGLIAGAIAWIVILIWGINDMACSRVHSCDAGDMFLFAIIAAGMIVPATIFAWVVSSFFSKKE